MSWKKTFQESNSSFMEQMMTVYETNMNIMIMMSTMITYLMMIMSMNKMTNTKNIENQKMENTWTKLTTLMIVMMTIKSIKILFLINEMNMPTMTIKVISNQWFWTYEYMNTKKKINSYLMLKKNFNFMNLETNNKMIMPMMKQIQMISTSMDVIHSWTVPSMNIKMDSIPNHLNQTSMISYKTNLMFGQCSEICGMNHSLMPIQIESIKMKNFIKWMK